MSKTRKSKWATWVVVALVLAAGIGGGALYLQHNQDDGPQFQTADVTRGDLTQVVTATGQLGPVVTVQVGSQISGIIRKIFVDYNSVVKSNQIIAQIDPSTCQINVLKAEADLANSKATMTLAQVEAHRSDSLFTNNLISGSDQDSAQAKLLQAKAAVQSDEATLQNARVQLSYCTIYAPVDGVVVSRNVDVGQTVASSFNTPTLFLIANDLAKMQIDALVSEADIGSVAIGQDVRFSVDAFPNRTFMGKLSQIRYGAITNQNVINYDCVVNVDNAELKLFPGMTANVSIIVAQRQNSLKIPNAALRVRPDSINPESRTNTPSGSEVAAAPAPTRDPAARENRRSDRREGDRPKGERPKGDRQVVRTVYVMPKTADAHGQLKPQPVKIKVGINDGISTEVLDGLDEGAQVVTSVINTSDSSPSSNSRPANNPFGGNMRRF